MQPPFQFVPAVEIEQRGGDLDKEKHPLDGPSPHIDMDQVARGRGTDQSDGKPDAHPADRPKDHRHQHKKLGMRLQPAQQRHILVPPRLAFRHHQKKPASDSEVRNKHVQNRHQSDQKSGAKGDLPNRIVHAAPPVAVLDAVQARADWLLSTPMARYWQSGPGLSNTNSCRFGKGAQDKILQIGRKRGFDGQSGTGVPHSMTLRVQAARPRCRQVLERGRASAAFPLAPAVMSGNLSQRLGTKSRRDEELFGQGAAPSVAPFFDCGFARSLIFASFAPSRG